MQTCRQKAEKKVAKPVFTGSRNGAWQSAVGGTGWVRELPAILKNELTPITMLLSFTPGMVFAAKDLVL